MLSYQLFSSINNKKPLTLGLITLGQFFYHLYKEDNFTDFCFSSAQQYPS